MLNYLGEKLACLTHKDATIEVYYGPLLQELTTIMDHFSRIMFLHRCMCIRVKVYTIHIFNRYA